MNLLYERISHIFERTPSWLIRWRYWVLLIFIASTAWSVYATVHYFNLDKSFEAWFKEGDSTLHDIKAFRAQFGNDDAVYLVYKPEDGNVFSASSLATISALHQALDDARYNKDAQSEHNQGFDHIERITSLYNAPFQMVDKDVLKAQRLLMDLPFATSEQRERLKRIAQKQDTWTRRYFSDDGRYGGIMIETDLGTEPITPPVSHEEASEDALLGDDDLWVDDDSSAAMSDMPTHEQAIDDIQFKNAEMDDYMSLYHALNSVIQRPEFKDFTVHYSGTIAMFEFSERTMEQAAMLMLIMIVLIIGILWFLFRSLSAVVWPVLVVAGSAFMTIGTLSWLGVVLSEMVNLTFMLIMAVGIADCVHVMSAYTTERNQGVEHKQAMAAAYKATGLPILLTSLTTMVGMLSLLISNLPQIGTFGVSSAIGVMLAFVLTLLVLPSMLDIWPPQKKTRTAQIQSASWLSRFLGALPLWVERHRFSVVLAFSAVLGLLVFGTTQARIDTNIVELTKKDSTLRVATEIIDNNLSGAQNLELMVNFHHANAFKNADVLQALSDFQEAITQKYPERVIKTFSIADYVKETHRAMNENQEAFYSIPDDSRLSAQLLYLFDNANPEDRQRLVSDDYSISHVSIMLKNAGSYEYRSLFKEIPQLMEQFLAPLTSTYPDVEMTTTGAMSLIMRITDLISRAQIQSFAMVIGIISAILIVTLLSLKAGLLAMIPNILPGLFVVGVFGLLDIAMDTDTLIIAPIIIGIAVDDTIHFMTHYRQTYLQTGHMMDSLIETTTHVGRAVIFTTLVLAIGFSVLSFSDYLGLAKIGFGSLAILLALLCDLLLLPALILIFKPTFGRPHSQH